MLFLSGRDTNLPLAAAVLLGGGLLRVSFIEVRPKSRLPKILFMSGDHLGHSFPCEIMCILSLLSSFLPTPLTPNSNDMKKENK